uniref:Uncharacterized protein n=1 Tax=Arundo donax TaxID=35708 RepID=A0A0A9B209_ARUDO
MKALPVVIAIGLVGGIPLLKWYHENMLDFLLMLLSCYL